MGVSKPVVPSTAYDDRYYREVSAGAPEWTESEGSRFGGLFEGYAQRLGIAEGEVLVDVGTGRGELLAVAARRGATAIGVEYSFDALRFCARSVEGQQHASPAAADARALPLRDGIADAASMFDVVEHLSPAEVADTLVEIRRILRPGGRLLIHTLPTRTIYELTYRLQRLSRPARWRRWPADPRHDDERNVHINEQTRTRLRRSLVDAGFRDVDVHHGEWIYTDFVPDPKARALYHRLARFRATGWLGRADLWAEARR